MKWKTTGAASPLKPPNWVTQNRARGEGKSKIIAVMAFITSQNLEPVQWL